MTRPATFLQADVSRVVKAAVAAGVQVASVMVRMPSAPGERIEIVTLPTAPATQTGEAAPESVDEGPPRAD